MQRSNVIYIDLFLHFDKIIGDYITFLNSQTTYRLYFRLGNRNYDLVTLELF
jgi:hypothetical protein